MTNYNNEALLLKLNDEAAIQQLHDDILYAFNTLNLDKLLSLQSDNIVLIEPDMPAIRGKAEVIQLFKKFQQQELDYKLSYTIQELEVFGKTAFVHGQLMKQIAQNNEAPMHEAARFSTLSQKRDDGKWLMHAFVNNDPGNFSFFSMHFNNSERIGKVGATHDGFPEEGTKDVSDSGPKDLVYRMILSTVNLLHNDLRDDLIKNICRKE